MSSKSGPIPSPLVPNKTWTLEELLPLNYTQLEFDAREYKTVMKKAETFKDFITNIGLTDQATPPTFFMIQQKTRIIITHEKLALVII